MKRILTTAIKRLLVLGVVAVAVALPSVANADPFFAPDNGFVNITATCDHFFGVGVTTISTSDYPASQRLWGRTYLNGVYGQWQLLYDWQPVTGTEQRYEPVTKTQPKSRWVELYAHVAFLTQSGWQYSARYLTFANHSSAWGHTTYACWT